MSEIEKLREEINSSRKSTIMKNRTEEHWDKEDAYSLIQFVSSGMIGRLQAECDMPPDFDKERFIKMLDEIDVQRKR